MKVAVTRPIPSSGLDALAAGGFDVTVRPLDHPASREELMALVSEADGLISMLTDRIDDALLQHAPRLKVVANYAVGFDNFDVAAATARGVVLCNTPGVLTEATADIAWTLLMAAARRAGEGERFLRAGQFHGWGPLMLLGQDIHGRTLAILGAGRIGTAVARRATGFGMKILYTKRSGPSAELDALGARHVTTDEAITEADFFSIHLPLTPETRHLIGEKELRRMLPHAVVVNTGRGPVIDEQALAKALREGWIAAAGLDVFEREPIVHPDLLACENAVLLPHIGSATHGTRDAMAHLAAGNVMAVLRGEAPQTCVNPEVLGIAGRLG